MSELSATSGVSGVSCQTGAGCNFFCAAHVQRERGAGVCTCKGNQGSSETRRFDARDRTTHGSSAETGQPARSADVIMCTSGSRRKGCNAEASVHERSTAGGDRRRSSVRSDDGGSRRVATSSSEMRSADFIVSTSGPKLNIAGYWAP